MQPAPETAASESAETWPLPPLDVAPFEPHHAQAARLQFSIRDILGLVVGCGLYFGLLRLASSLASQRFSVLGIDQAMVSTFLFGLMPIALLGLWPRPTEPPAAAPLVPGQMLWRICGLLYPLGYGLVFSVGMKASPLWIGLLGMVVIWLSILGGLLLAECGAGRRPFPAVHKVGMGLYLCFLPALILGLAVMLVW